MPTYALYNTEKKVFLEHPVAGLWLSPDLIEAQEMQKAAHAYLIGLGLRELLGRIVLVNYETKEVIPPI